MSTTKDENLSGATTSSSSGSKKIRMTLACERCRSKKVRCNFAHPTCTRCQQTKSTCSYTGSSTQVDLFNLVKINETVDLLQKRVLSLESDLKEAQDTSPSQAVTTASIATEPTAVAPMDEDILMASASRTITKVAMEKDNEALQGLLSAANSRWSLSLTPRGLRIDTNIVSLHDLYDLLLSGMSQLEIGDSQSADVSTSDIESRSTSPSGSNSLPGTPNPTTTATSSSSSSSSSSSPPPPSSVQRTTLLKKKPLWKSGLKVFPLYSSWESISSQQQQHHRQQQTTHHLNTVPKSTLDKMMSIYAECFLCLPSPELDGSIMDRYRKGQLDEMLANIVFAWTARHGAIYHDLFVGQDPNQVGEPFFNRAKLLLKDRFMVTNVDTMHSLLMMYIYALGDPSSHAESEAYMYLGLANRMCLDLKMHCEVPKLAGTAEADPVALERNRRYYGVLNFLETLCTVHSDKPFSLPPPDTVTVGIPTVLAHETGETRWRVEFMIQRFRITHIYRDIICKTAQEKPLLSTVSALDKELKEWYQQLPSYFKYKHGDIHKRNWKSKSFKEQACIKLNFEYNFQMCQLYGLFFSRARDDNSDDSPTAVDVLAKELCVRGAEMIIELLGCWVQLEQLWCHFSLETFMIVLMVYGTLLTHASPAEVESAKTNLTWMARMLAHSPVSHHKHVIGLVKRIESMFLEFLGENLVLETGRRTGIKREYVDYMSTPASPPLPSSSLSAPSYTTSRKHRQLHTTQSHKPSLETPASSSSSSSSSSTSGPSQPANASTQFAEPQYSTPTSLQQPTTLMMHMYGSSSNSVMDVATGTSPFDLHKTHSMCNVTTSDLPFSDFLYTPTLTDLQPMTASAQYQHQQDEQEQRTQTLASSPTTVQRTPFYYQVNRGNGNTTSTPITAHGKTPTPMTASISTPTSSGPPSTLISSDVNLGYPSYQLFHHHHNHHQQQQQQQQQHQHRLGPNWPSEHGNTTPSPPSLNISPSMIQHHQHQHYPNYPQQQHQSHSHHPHNRASTSSCSVSSSTPPPPPPIPLPSTSSSATQLHHHPNITSHSHASSSTVAPSSSFGPSATPTSSIPFLGMEMYGNGSDQKLKEQQDGHGFGYY
ncbi:hypothetical protein BCR42DRAFT_104864 [Absidia repens]|uniref:Zn(2)-C6 fungal-type domain-containing protein n=1 Tax=Absidia repens TaxID=90262 RepID=A0A1X2I7Y4_9FUNG|nr:hypothetical protein BCR42DRAFT_104864 [Absidia repens]